MESNLCPDCGNYPDTPNHEYGCRSLADSIDHWVDYGKPEGYICSCPVNQDHVRPRTLEEDDKSIADLDAAFDLEAAGYRSQIESLTEQVSLIRSLAHIWETVAPYEKFPRYTQAQTLKALLGDEVHDESED